MNEIDKVLTVFRGISTQDAALATKYMNAKRYVEHNPLAGDGVEGVKEYIHRLGAPGHGALQVIRAFQDGAYVVTQADGEIQGQGVFFDVFRFEDGLIVEHWAFSSKAGPPNKSGHTQVDGPTKATHLEDTDKNKSVARGYYEAFHIQGRRDVDVIARYFSGDHCVRHEPGVADGVGEFLHDVERLTRDRTIDEIKLLVGQGDFVFLAGRGTHRGEPCVYIDLYRVEDDRMVEHWGFPQAVPPSIERKNHNEML